MTTYGSPSAASPASAPVAVPAPAANPFHPAWGDISAALSKLTRSGFQTSEFALVAVVLAMIALAVWGGKLDANTAAIVGAILTAVFHLIRASVKEKQGDVIVSLADTIAANPKAALKPANLPALIEGAAEIEHRTIGSEPEPVAPEAAAATGMAMGTLTQSGHAVVAVLTATLAALAVSYVACVYFCGCSTTGPNPAANARNAAIDQVLRDSAGLLGKGLVNGLVSAASQEMQGGKVNWLQAGGAALQFSISSADIATEIDRAQTAANLSGATAGKTPLTTSAALQAYDGAVAAGLDPNAAKQVIANVIFAQTGAPPAHPAAAIAQAVQAGQTLPVK